MGRGLTFIFAGSGLAAIGIGICAVQVHGVGLIGIRPWTVSLALWKALTDSGLLG